MGASIAQATCFLICKRSPWTKSTPTEACALMSSVKVHLMVWAAALMVPTGVLVSTEEGVGTGLYPGLTHCLPHRTWAAWEGPRCAAQDSASAWGFWGFDSGTYCSGGRQPDVGTRGHTFRAARGAPSRETSRPWGRRVGGVASDVLRTHRQ